MSDDEEYKVVRLEVTIVVDGKELKLPTDAGEGYPHIIKIDEALQNYIPDFGIPSGLSPIDAIVTTLYKWKPKAVVKLLDWKKTPYFYWRRVFLGYELFIKRNDDQVTVGSREMKLDVISDFEATFKINENDMWKLGPQSHFNRRYAPEDKYGYAETFGQTLILDRAWEKGGLKKHEFFYADEGEEDVSEYDDEEAGSDMGDPKTSENDDS